MIWMVAGMVFLAGLPLVLTLSNLRLYAKPRSSALSESRGWIGVCVPARNEESNIEACVRSLLEQTDERVRVYVYDDQSTDRTGEILAALREQDDRVRSVEQVELPEGWNGKQHGCWRAGSVAIDEGCEWLLFTDADVRFSPEMAAQTRAEASRLSASLLSTFPRQLTGTISEALMVPMMFYLLFGYLPMGRMRATDDPNTSAGCGQFLFVSAAAYQAFGGHEAFKDTMHDGVKMPRAVRRAGYRSDLFDGSALAHVRMYRGFSESWRGFAKNAYEGLGSVGLLVFLTVIHLFAHVGPWVVIGWQLVSGWSWPIGGLAVVAAALPVFQRLLLAGRLGHTPLGALAHPVAIVLMTVVQWWSYVLQLRGQRAWRGRIQG